jgi:hypothetical protein
VLWRPSHLHDAALSRKLAAEIRYTSCQLCIKVHSFVIRPRRQGYSSSPPGLFMRHVEFRAAAGRQDVRPDDKELKDNGDKKFRGRSRWTTMSIGGC